MKANTKITVAEILIEAGYTPADVVGKVRVRVAGIPVNEIEKVITIQPGTKEIEVIVGQESKVVEIDGDNEEKVITEGARASLDVEGQALEAGEKHTEPVKEEVSENKENPSEPVEE